MKKLIISICAIAAFGIAAAAQNYSVNILKRMQPIMDAVQITSDEQAQLAVVIRTYQTDLGKARKAGDKEAEATVEKAYEDGLVEVLGQERYDAFQAAQRAAKLKVATPSTLKRLEPITAAVEVNDAEKEALIVAINTFQADMRVAANANDTNMKKKVRQDYEASLKAILGEDRYNSYKAAEKAARQ